jgi:hypothetical protein
VTHVFLSDLFADEYTGGAELTTEALISGAPESVSCFKVRSKQLTENLIRKHRDKTWVLVNFTGSPKREICDLVTQGVRFHVIECDYKYCIHRSPQLCKIQTKEDCTCHGHRNAGLFVRSLYKRAQSVSFMSHEQMGIYKSLFPGFNSENFSVLSSVFSPGTIELLKSLRESREKNGFKNRWAILSGATWIKAEGATIEYAKRRGLPFELVGGGMSPDQFLRALAEYRGLIFRPAGWDTCPRLVIEAKMMGLDLILNENVQHRDEPWFKGSDKETERYLESRVQEFWDLILSGVSAPGSVVGSMRVTKYEIP